MTNEKRILIEFLREFNPICAGEDLENWTYEALVLAVKETVEEM